MEQINLYEGIFKRKSIRKYNLTSLDTNILKEISEYMNNLKPMYDHIETEMKIVSQEVIHNLLPIKAPHYIIVFSENKEGYLTNVGFMLQQIDLFLSINGIGSCWVGMAKPTKAILNESRLEFVIALAFGKTIQPLYRENIMEFKRKTLDKISNITEKNELMEAARLAPSATNSQPWYFVLESNLIHVYCVKPNILKAIIYKRLNQIDIGIAICHLWIAAKHFNKQGDFICDQGAQDNPPTGYYYVTTVKVQ